LFLYNLGSLLFYRRAALVVSLFPAIFEERMVKTLDVIRCIVVEQPLRLLVPDLQFFCCLELFLLLIVDLCFLKL
jgi:hypothetical protein